MTPTEIERLLVRLVGDATQYRQMLAEAQAATEQAGTKMSSSIVAIGTVAAQGFMQLGNLLRGYTQQMLADWGAQEDALVGLQAVIRGNVENVRELTKDYTEFASSIQDVTTYGDEAVLSLLETAESFGLTGEAAKKAARDAIALAQISHSSAAAMVRVAAMVAQGDYQRAMLFTRMIPQLRGVKNETEFLARYTHLAETGWSAATEKAKTWTGQLEQLRNAIGDVREELGKALAETLQPFVGTLKELAKDFLKLPPEVKQVISAVVSLMGAFVVLGTVITTLSKVIIPGLRIAFNLLFTGPTGFIIGVIAALGTLGYMLYDIIKKAQQAKTEAVTPAVGLAEKFEHLEKRERWFIKGQEEENRRYEALVREYVHLKKLYDTLQITEAEEKRYFEIKRQLYERSKVVEKLKAEEQALKQTAKAVDEYIAKLEEERQGLGQSAEYRELLKRGLTEEQRKRVDAAIKLTEETKARFEAERSVRSMIESLNEEREALELGEKAARLNALQRKGVSEELLRELKIAQDLRDSAKQRKKDEEEARKLLEKATEPQELLNRKIAELNRIYHEGLLGRGPAALKAWQIGIEEARKEIESLQSKTVDITFNVRGIEAIRAGSAEALAAIRAFEQRPQAAALMIPKSPDEPIVHLREMAVNLHRLVENRIIASEAKLIYR